MKDRINDFLAVYEREMLEEGEKLDKEKLPELTEDLFSQFEKNGNRLDYENVYFGRRKFLTVYAMLAVMYGKAKDILRLEEVIEAVCDEECWALPAHVNRKDEDWRTTIDLFAAETAFSLAEIIRILDGKISKNVCDKAKGEVFRRVLNPFMEKEEQYYGWETAKMNWCAVCCGSIGSAAIWLMQDDKKKLDKLIDRISKSIWNYLDSFSDDGTCLEGLGYYTYGMMFFVAFADLAYKYSIGRIDLFKAEKLNKIALFQQKCFLSDNISLSFSDSGKDEKYRVGLTSYLTRRYAGVVFPPKTMAAGLHSDNCYRYVVISRDYFWCLQCAENERKEEKWHTVLPMAQWSICKSKNGCVMAAKGGFNGEPHNHNDVGSFLYVADDEMVLDDIGYGEYTKDYFNENRYTHLCCRSLGHSVPIIDGREQSVGRRFKASRFEADGYGKTVIGMEKAYGLEKKEKVTRTINCEIDTGVCTVTDEFVFNSDRVVKENLITSHKPKIVEDGFVITTRKHEYKVEVSNGADYEIVDETYVDHFGVRKKVWLLQWKVIARVEDRNEACFKIFKIV